MDSRRRVGRAIRAAVLAVPAMGCAAGDCPDPPEEERFRWVDQVVDVNDVADVFALTDSETVRCKELCQVVEWRRYREIGELDTCSYELVGTSVGPEGATDAQVSCSGTAHHLCAGRLPVGAAARLAPPPEGLGPALARFARDERSAVVAFEQLATALEALGAPRSLIRRSRRAAEQERRHDRWLSAEAEQRGHAVPAVEVPDAAPTRLQLAVTNAEQGCANEAAAALLAHAMAAGAPTASLRRIFARIAADETAHAALSWDLHAWLTAGLAPEEQAVVSRALGRALAAIPDVLAHEAAGLPASLGVGDPASAARRGRVLAQALAA